MKDKEYLEIAIGKAEESLNIGGFPAGCIIVKDEAIVSEGIAIGFSLNDPTSHPETSAIRKACDLMKTTDLSGSTLYSSMEPCLMCFSAANWAGISKIVFACKKKNDMISKGYYEGENDIFSINEKNSNKIQLFHFEELEADALKIMERWEIKNKI